MTNEQLIVLLEGFIVQLGRAIIEADALLPEDVERRAMRQHIGQASPVLAHLDHDPANWESVVLPGADAVALDPLREFLEGLALHVTTLEGIK